PVYIPRPRPPHPRL
nr:Chain z, Apidaecin [Apis mellifera]6GWT_z Chain z, Apidaecin [Apis mellifera]6GXM_z Chain z, Apidaecin [Escherichia coli]6GXN_z Chain z, Apidaecin [Apis mellifera]6GXO_z Chain z, Apidaecin [Apis mellifera]6GXP_z Chain z, Apidaecin [Apis mellifera]6YSS_v Chain v, Api137 [Apis mellifera]6YST_v Chain v, Api137 [Apis mellifera]6YSU_v Chain v, Api137 [Apis mellifera]